MSDLISSMEPNSDKLTVRAGITYRWLDPDLSRVEDADRFSKADEKARAALAMGEAMKQAEQATEKSGLFRDVKLALPGRYDVRGDETPKADGEA